MTKIAVIIGSTRQGRSTDRLAKWATEEVKKHADVEIIDLADYPLPFFDEAISPRYNQERKPTGIVAQWLSKIAEFDGYVLVTPEYNRSTSGVVKNAIDFLDFQMENKPVALIGHGSSGGAQAVANLRMMLPGVGAVTIPQALFFAHPVGQAVSEEGELSEALQDNPYGPQTHLAGQIESLIWYTNALNRSLVPA